MPLTVGVISDTHGLLRPQALTALAGVDHILHAGDVGDASLLETLRTIAPTTAIRGNVDTVGSCATLPATDFIQLGGKLFYLVHSIGDFDLNAEVASIHVVVYGHSHRVNVETRGGVLYLNPGSAGPRRFNLPVTVAKVTIMQGRLETEIITLPV